MNAPIDHIVGVNEMVFAREPLAGILESGLDRLLRAHWAEVAHDRDVIPLDPDWDAYLKLERAGQFLAFSLRDSGDLIGYTAFIVAKSMHYKGHGFAMNDVIYLRPEARGAEGLRMILEAEEFLRGVGVSKVFYHVKTDAFLGSPSGDSLEAIEARMDLEHRFGIDIPDDAGETGDRTLGACLAALGYRHVENHFGKLLKGKA